MSSPDTSKGGITHSVPEREQKDFVTEVSSACMCVFITSLNFLILSELFLILETFNSGKER